MKVIFAFTALFLSTSFFFPFSDGWCWDDRQWKEQHEFNMKMNDPQEFQKRKLEFEKQKKKNGITASNTSSQELRQSPGAIPSVSYDHNQIQPGDVLNPVAGGAYNMRTGEFYPKSGPGYVDTQNGEYMPSVSGGVIVPGQGFIPRIPRRY